MDAISNLIEINNTVVDQNHTVDKSSAIEIMPLTIESNAQPIAGTLSVLEGCAIPAAQECLNPTCIAEARSAYLGINSVNEITAILKYHPRGTYICYIASLDTPEIFVTWKSRQSDDIKTTVLVNYKELAGHVKVLQPYSQELENDPGFCRGISKEAAMDLLGRAPVGTYLIRLSTSKPNAYVIDVHGEGEINSHLLFRDGLNWKFKSSTCSLTKIKDRLNLNQPLTTVTFGREKIVGYRQETSWIAWNVRTLVIERCTLSGPYALDNLTKCFPNLTTLQIKNTECSMGIASFQTILEERPEIRLSVINCNRIWTEYTIHGATRGVEPIADILSDDDRERA